MKFYKKLISIVFSLVIISSSAVYASADEGVVRRKIGNDANKYFKIVSYNEELNELFANTWDTYGENVNIYKYRVREKDLTNIYCNISDLYPEYFYLDIASTTYSVNSYGYVTTIQPKYLYSSATCDKQRVQLDTAVDEVLGKMSGIQGVEDKVVFLHDYISTHNEYDPDAITANIAFVDDYSFTAYGCLVNKVSVCQGMSDAFVLLCNKLSIPVGMANSDDMVHAWNFVKVGDYYYHLDITWDDSAFETGFGFSGTDFLDVKGYASHEYFMKSDLQMANLDHYAWDRIYEASEEEKYTNYYWDGVYSHIYYINGFQYYMKDSSLIKRNPLTKKETVLYTVSDSKFSVGELSYNWESDYTVLAYNYADKFLLMNLSDGVYAYSLVDNTTSKVFDYTEDGFVAGILFEENTLYYDVVSVKDGKYYQISDNSTQITLPENLVVYGDVNSSGVFDVSDILEMRMYLANYGNTINEFTADVNKDNSVDTKDLLMQVKKLAGYEVNFGG